MELLYKNEDIDILIVDDNKRNVQIIGQILLAQKYKVSFATSGAEAILMVNNHPSFDLILLDILMPEVDGYEVCESIKKNDKSKDIPIIFLTAKCDKASVVKGLKMGANDYVVKPFYDDELLLRVKTQIDLKKQNEKLDNVNHYLEETVKEKTAALQVANNKLSILEKAKSDFLVLISHELRTPLNIINGFTEILNDALQDSEHIDELMSLQSSTDRLISLAETALLITEIKLGKYTLDYDTVDLEEVCKHVSWDTKTRYPDKKLSQNIFLEDGVNFIFGDRGLILDAIKKIIENSIIECKELCEISYNIKKDNTNIILEIKDNGPGFSDSDLERLFQLFAKEGPNTNHDGFGLDLAAIKLVMEIHTGDVIVNNPPEGGASVSLVFKDNANQ